MPCSILVPVTRILVPVNQHKVLFCAPSEENICGIYLLAQLTEQSYLLMNWGSFLTVLSGLDQEENQSQEKWTTETKCCEKDDTLPLE